ncbi:hypothetical protein DPEC_G00214670 [Dallia pectoralis]|uniref:Uncharacterized protein n=1 Tax=Dallia pectoralis TaxID=75939 RepID=A0ACC2G2A6_DALPE|nr:hypothetical protein DPEC_G00214670 [Dallia pectoralis]
MSLTGGREDRGTASETSLSGEHDTTAKSPIQLERPTSPVPSCVSKKSDRSMNPPVTFRKVVSRDHKERPTSPVPSCVSMKSDKSMEPPITFRKGVSRDHKERPTSPVPICWSMKSDKSMESPITFRKVVSRHQQKELADTLEKSQPAMICQRELKSNLKNK